MMTRERLFDNLCPGMPRHGWLILRKQNLRTWRAYEGTKLDTAREVLNSIKISMISTD